MAGGDDNNPDNGSKDKIDEMMKKLKGGNGKFPIIYLIGVIIAIIAQNACVAKKNKKMPKKITSAAKSIFEQQISHEKKRETKRYNHCEKEQKICFENRSEIIFLHFHFATKF